MTPPERNRDVWQSGDWDKVAPYIGEAGPRLLDDIGAVGPACSCSTSRPR